MLIRFTKGRGKPDMLACVRDDGSSTWAVLNFTPHDFGHYALETTLGWQDAFFGLLAQGWDITDFGRADTQTGNKPVVPAQAMQAEALAGLLDMERRSGCSPPHATFLEMLTSVCAGLGVPAPDLTPEQLALIRSRHADLLCRWPRVPPGAALEMTF